MTNGQTLPNSHKQQACFSCFFFLFHVVKAKKKKKQKNLCKHLAEREEGIVPAAIQMGLLAFAPGGEPAGQLTFADDKVKHYSTVQYLNC